MSDETTWVVLGDGRYVRILINKGRGPQLLTLKADDLEALEKLNYEIITRRTPGVAGEAPGRDYYELVAKFLEEQLQAGLYHRMILVGSPDILKKLKDAMKDKVGNTVVGEYGEDLLARPVNEIEEALDGLIAT